jgi:hypothetical protein
MAKQQVFKLRGRGGVNGYSPPLIRTAVRGAVVAERRWEPHGVGLNGAHEVWVKQVNPHQGPTPLTGIQVFTDTVEYR